MRRSQLEICVDILDNLSVHGPLKLTHVMYKTGVNCRFLRQQMDFLVENGLIEQRTVQKKRSLKVTGTAFAITQQGQNTLKSFRELNKLLPIEENQPLSSTLGQL